ncbi:type VI secretion system baseplate subunit TssE [Limnohabitans sp. Jir72]|uniref:type VI secretion system baseplate subunit TssE n=1 Tax=Limnohabitans sp. Jir72 TaxID=1977909 RepID=UPI001E51666A|nr:type VI secretion system baseplate subunit TssE [Limnohabitans sp. Jir72]
MTEHVTDVNEAAMPGALHPAARALPSAHGLVQRQGEQVFMPTLLDRLCDDAPHESSEAPQAYAFNRGRMRETVLRDLSLLLNTTDQSDLINAAQYPAAANSTLNYGVPALAGGYLSEKKWADIERMIRRAITQFEPRLVPQTLRVRPLLKDQASANYNVLTFEISGHIQISSYPIEFTVQSAVDLENSRIELRPR